MLILDHFCLKEKKKRERKDERENEGKEIAMSKSKRRKTQTEVRLNAVFFLAWCIIFKISHLIPSSVKKMGSRKIIVLMNLSIKINFFIHFQYFTFFNYLSISYFKPC